MRRYRTRKPVVPIRYRNRYPLLCWAEIDLVIAIFPVLRAANHLSVGADGMAQNRIRSGSCMIACCFRQLGSIGFEAFFLADSVAGEVEGL